MQQKLQEDDMEKKNGTTVMEEAMKKAQKQKKSEKVITVGGLPDTSGIGVVIVEEVASGPSYEERRKWAEDLGRKEAENKAEKLRLESECSGEIGLLPGPKQIAYRAIEAELKKIAAAVAAVDDGLKGHVAVAALIRKAEMLTKSVIEKGVIVGADMLLRGLVESKRYRYATASEKDALTSKKGVAASHVVIGHDVIIVPLELTAANKVLSERLLALIKAEKNVFKAREAEKVARMRARATITLREVLDGKVPADGQKCIVYLAAPKKKTVGYRDGAPMDIWHPAFQMLLEVKDSRALHILQVNGGPKITEVYEDMKKRSRSLLLAFVKSGEITTRIEGDTLFKDTRRFLADVIRGLENEDVEAQKVVEPPAKEAVAAELAEAFKAKEATATA